MSVTIVFPLSVSGLIIGKLMIVCWKVVSSTITLHLDFRSA